MTAHQVIVEGYKSFEEAYLRADAEKIVAVGLHGRESRILIG
jgi:hypothetical protein